MPDSKPTKGGNSRMYWYNSSIALIALTLVGCGGTGPELAKVRGRVEFDGKSLPKFENAAVVFTPPGGRLAKGVIETDGTFELSTYQSGDGAAVGNAKVTVTAAVKDKTPESDRYG